MMRSTKSELMDIDCVIELTLPVPFLARARISRPDKAIGMACSWIGEGFSNPAV